MPLEPLFKLNKGVLADVKKAVDKGKSSVIFYAPEYNRYHIASQLNKRFLYVAGDIVAARKAYDALVEYCDGEVAIFPDREDVLIRRKTSNTTLLSQRIAALYGLIFGKYQGVVATAEGIAQFYPEVGAFRDSVITIRKEESLDVEALVEALVTMGYRRTELIDGDGQFSVRGDTIDVFPLTDPEPIRISLFGDVIEEIRYFDPDTMAYKGETEEVTILPSTDFIVSENEVEGILNAIKKEVKKIPAEAKERLAELVEEFTLRPSDPINTFFIPYQKNKSTILDYLPSDGVVIYDDTKQIEDKLRLLHNGVVQRVDAMKESFAAFESHKFSSADIGVIASDKHVKIGFGRITSNVSMFAPQEVFSIKATALPAFYNDMPAFFEQLRGMSRNGASVVIACRDENALNALKDHCFDEEVDVYVGANKGGISLTVADISKGFIYPAEKIMLVGINDLSRKVDRSRSAKSKRVVFEIPEKGDYVVHEKHGIGISEGIQKVKTTSGEKDYYVVMYRDGDRLYLPCDQLDSLEKYNGGDKPALHKIGGAEFERVKKRVKESIKKMAIDLLSLYRSRYGKKGYKYQPDSVWQKEMEEDFPYAETDDQLVAISEIKRDMESGKIMDRLLCGDVGFGKTEVAMRAVFKTVIEGKQAAILAPTTILAQQHYELIKARFAKFKIKVDLLSRFVPPKEIKEALKRIESGETSVIVATHRLLGKDVKFADLGLLVLDEEQRFGVEHKEKLKLYRDTVNILSLSATPIPRTLHMALSGIRDISTLENPPRNRLPVETYVTEYNDNLLVDAVNKELNRGGQVFILYNRVDSIEEFFERVKGLLDPSVKIVFAHGQMDEDLLEDRIRDFYENKAQVLISTTIIENGIDLPNANTLFVLNADTLGLAQLYQLRGRVGRSDVPAYAYFTVPEGKVLTTNAVQRLGALMDNTELGSGFRIAMRDLEIRGAGNVLGREQSGQMEKVGYETYLKLVQEGLDEAQGKEVEEEKEIEMVIDGDYALDEKYIPDSRGRITFYKKISVLESREEGQEYYDYLKKNYGDPPPAVKTIIRAGIIKNLAKKLGAEKVVVGKKGAGIYFYDAKVLTDEKLFGAMEYYKDYAILSPSTHPVVVFNVTGLTDAKRIKLVLDFLIKATA